MLCTDKSVLAMTAQSNDTIEGFKIPLNPPFSKGGFVSKVILRSGATKNLGVGLALHE